MKPIKHISIAVSLMALITSISAEEVNGAYCANSRIQTGWDEVKAVATFIDIPKDCPKVWCAFTIDESWSAWEDVAVSFTPGQTTVVTSRIAPNRWPNIWQDGPASNAKPGFVNLALWSQARVNNSQADCALQIKPSSIGGQANLQLLAPISNDTYNFIASESINASNVISTNAKVHYGAPSVNLIPGFSAKLGSVFIANSTLSNSLKSVKEPRSVNEYEQNTDNGINTLSNNNIFPNPTQGEFTLRMDLPENLTSEIRVFDSMGKLVKTVVASSTEILVSIEDQPAGIYFVRYTVDGKDQSAKIVKL